MIVIPAKYVSTRTPQKNFRPFYRGLSLLQIAAIRSVTASCGPVAISSENIDAVKEQMLGLPDSIRHSVAVHERGMNLARDPATILDVLVDYLASLPDGLPANVSTALPTSPFNSVSAIRGAWDVYRRSDAQKLLSVSPASKPPFNAWIDCAEGKTGELRHAFPDNEFRLTQSTACPPTYFSNGCISIYSVDTLMGDREFGSTIGFKMSEVSGIDIDFEYEFDSAKALFADWCEDRDLIDSQLESD